MVGASANSSHRPALDDLHVKQKALVERFGEFETMWEVVEWSHDAVILTAGRISQKFLRSMACLYGEKLIQRAVLAPFGSENGEYLRQQAVSQAIVPACRAAVEEVRFRVTEYGENPPDAERAEHVAFRPAWEELREKQRTVLREWCHGFEDLEGATEWSQDLMRAVLGEENREFVEGVTGGLELVSEAAVRSSAYARENPELCGRMRMGIASMRLLPWMCDAVRKQVSRASEQTVIERPETPEYELGEDLTPGES